MTVSQSNPKTNWSDYPITVQPMVGTPDRIKWDVLGGFDEVSGTLKVQLTGRQPNKPFEGLTAGHSLKKGLGEAIIEAKAFLGLNENRLFLVRQ